MCAEGTCVRKYTGRNGREREGMEGEERAFCHECVSLSSVHTLCHCGTAFDSVAGALDATRGLKACDFTCQIQESGTLPPPSPQKGTRHEEERRRRRANRYTALCNSTDLTRLVAEESSG